LGIFFGVAVGFGVFLVVVGFLVFFFLSSKSEPSDAEVYFTALVARPDLRVDIFAFGVSRFVAWLFRLEMNVLAKSLMGIVKEFGQSERQSLSHGG
jgi:hypothetical protein